MPGCLCIECINFGSETDCLSPINVVFENISQTTIEVTWDPSPNAVTYTVEFKESTSNTWLSNPDVNHPIVEDTLISLTADTSYDIRVLATCASSACYSLVQTVETLPLEEE